MKTVSFTKFSSYHYKNLLIFAFILFLIGCIIYFKPLSNRPTGKLDIAPWLCPNDYPPCPVGELDLDWELEENLKSLDQADPRLIKYSRIKYLTPPSKLPYNEDVGDAKPDKFSGMVAEIFGNQRNGIFIEAGANEGVYGSHSLYLEKHLNWTGLLVECNPNLIPKLKSHHRKAWIAACLAPGIKPGILNFSVPTNWSYSGTFGKQWNVKVGGKSAKWFQLEVETIPLFTLLAGIGWTTIDFFSFDIEGAELAVLREFPFDLITFKLLIIEVFFYNQKQKKELDELMRINNYYFISGFDHDKIYVHGSVKDKLNFKRFAKNSKRKG